MFFKQVEVLQSKLLNQSNVLKENENLTKQVANLRKLISNNLMLEGQLEEFKMQQKRAEENENELIQLRTDYASLKHDLKQWTDLARLYFPNKELENEKLLIVELRDFIEKSQRSILELNFQKKESENELECAKNKVCELTKTLDTQSLKEAKAKNLLEAHASTIRRLKKQNNLVTWERNDLRQMVDSFQKEVTLIGATAFTDTPPNTDKAKIEVLERVIEGYRQRMEHIEADQSVVCTVPDQTSSCSSEELKRVVTERDQLLKEKEDLLKREKELRDKVEHLNYQMEWRALKGDFDIRETKVLKLRLGPHEKDVSCSSSQESQLDLLKSDNEKLREKIKLLKEQIAAGEANQSKLEDITQLAESNVDASSNKKVQELNEKIESLELQGKRLREVYKASSQEFRETVYLLFGYKVDRTKNMYKLSSMYAEAPEENLLFQSTAGQVNLIETEYSKNLKSLMDLHLGRHHSIPMFLAALTQDLFQRQTFSMTNSTISV